MGKAVLLGLAGSFFFAVTFILNRSMDLGGGSYLWSACLRFFFMFPLLLTMVACRHTMGRVHEEILHAPGQWLLWSTVGFGLFYLPLTYAASYGEAWLVAGLWQMTIVMGALVSLCWGQRLPKVQMAVSLFILLGVYLLQSELGQGQEAGTGGNCLVAIGIASIAYPLGNRQMMRVCALRLGTMERVYGMTLCSLPFWFLVAVIAGGTYGGFSWEQGLQSLIVALSSGVIATLLFFQATNLVSHQPQGLAVVEATQAGEVVFSLLGSWWLLGDALPSPLGLSGLCIIVLGIIGNSLLTRKRA